MPASVSAATSNAAPDVMEVLIDDAGDGASSRAIRIAGIWFAAWTTAVIGMAALVSAQKAIPFRYAILPEALNYYTLAALSLVVWQASASMAAKQWSPFRQAGSHV